MSLNPKTIRGQIDCLARLTGAPDSFVKQVRSLFRHKGISLENEVSPYIMALEEAFRREESIRQRTARAKASLAGLDGRFTRLGEAYRRQLSQLRQLRGARKSSTIRNEARATRARRRLAGRTTVVTATQRDTMVMVPGPEDVQ